MIRFAAYALALMSVCFAVPSFAESKKAPPAKTAAATSPAQPAQFSAADLANAKLASTEIDSANKSIKLAEQTMKLAEHDIEDAKRLAVAADQRRAAILERYHLKLQDLGRTVIIDDEGRITRRDDPASSPNAQASLPPGGNGSTPPKKK
jgi:hypothetical protein